MGTSQIIANRFEISDLERDLLKKGGMGNVYQGTDMQNGQAVAIKVINPDLIADDPNLMNVKLKSGTPRIMDPGRNLLIVSSCGACGTEEFETKMDALPKVGDMLRIDSSVLRTVDQSISKRQPLFKACGGTHAVGLFDRNGKILASAEDTGRHNALDKAIGKCLLEGLPFTGSGAVLSGRVSLEMVGKCARAGVELISAISAPTSLSVEMAERLNITLCAFVRESRATVFTHPARVTG